MKNSLIFLLLILVFAACKDDEDPIPTADFEQDVISYDGAPNDAPQLPRGLSYTAVRFHQDDLLRSNHIGREILGVDFWIQDVPDAVRILIHRWNPNTSQEPGAVLYEHTLAASDLSPNSWINHDLTQTLDVPEQGFWISLEIDAGNRDLRVTGCDPGPRHPNGDVMGVFGANLPGWTSFFDYSSQQVSINWNIRTILVPQ